MNEKQEEKKKELSDKEDLFCRFYIKHWNGAKAARESGYSENSAKEIASQNLTKSHIQKHIEELQKDIAKLAGISRLSLVEDLISIKDNAEQDKDKIKSIEVINKMVGFNDAEKMDITTQGESLNEKTDFSNLSDDEMVLYGNLKKKAKGFEV